MEKVRFWELFRRSQEPGFREAKEGSEAYTGEVLITVISLYF